MPIPQPAGKEQTQNWHTLSSHDVLQQLDVADVVSRARCLPPRWPRANIYKLSQRSLICRDGCGLQYPAVGSSPLT